MPYYAVPGTQTAVASTYKTAAEIRQVSTTAAKRGKIYELLLGAASNPNATDTYLQFDVSRFTATGAGADTALVPPPLDPADSASVLTTGTNATAEMTAFTANSSLFNEGINQRASVRWVASQESQSLVLPSVVSNGLALRMQSSTYTATATGQISYQE